MSPRRGAAPDQFVPVAAVCRSGADESFHWGAVVALDRNGDVAWSAGDPDVVIYPRSSLKPLQAAAMLEAGVELDDAQLALACASHDGAPVHLDVVRSILAGVGLDETALANTPSWPLAEAAREEAIRAGRRPSSLQQNCSGKHAAMLATCVANGWPTEGYVDADHPVQQAITATIERATGGVEHVGVDGCGAPAASVGLLAMTRALRRLAVDGHRTVDAMTGHPELVGGPARDVTQLMLAVRGLVAKDGADGVYVAAHRDGRAVGVKIADGADRARRPVMAAALARLGLDAGRATTPVLGHGRPVGEVRAL